MKFSFNSLNDYIDLKDLFNESHKVFDKLTQAGFEVEDIEHLFPKFQGLLTAEVLEFKKHPSADRLRLCKVKADKKYSIVCGADNFKAGDKAVLIPPGCSLPGGAKISTRKILGETSSGMLLSLEELGFAPDEKDQGLLILEKNQAPGLLFAEEFGLKDIIFKLAPAPNRGDMLSHWGLARELSCLLNKKLKPLNKQSLSSEGSSVKKLLSLKLQHKSCLRYTGRALYDVQVKNSPLWLKFRLENLGFKSINNIVDSANYLMVMTGQPLHAFDLETLSQGLKIDLSRPGEMFKTLDHQELKLTGQELCIKDHKKVLALAGLMGGENSGVTKNTKNIFIESACFDPYSVRLSSKIHQLDTEAAYRFSRGVCLDFVKESLDKSAVFIQNLAGGRISKDFYDEGLKTEKKKMISIQKKDLESRLGREVHLKTFHEWMKKLSCEVKKVSSEKTEVYPPSFRFDLNIKEDLIEELARLEGYDSLPEENSLIPLISFHQPDSLEYSFSARLIKLLSGAGFYQAFNHSFMSQKFFEEFCGKKNFLHEYLGEKPLEPAFIKNPLSLEQAVMKTSLLPLLFKNAVHNIHQGEHSGRLFEVDPVFSRTKKGFEQHLRLGLLSWGVEEDFWDKKSNCPPVYHLKSTLENLLWKELSLEKGQWEEVSFHKAPNFLHPGQCLTLKSKEGQNLAYLGSLHPVFSQKYKIRQELALAELNIQALFTGRFLKNPDLSLCLINL